MLDLFLPQPYPFPHSLCLCLGLLYSIRLSSVPFFFALFFCFLVSFLSFFSFFLSSFVSVLLLFSFFRPVSPLLRALVSVLVRSFIGVHSSTLLSLRSDSRSSRCRGWWSPNRRGISLSPPSSESGAPVPGGRTGLTPPSRLPRVRGGTCRTSSP